MAIDAEKLEQYITELAGDDQDFAKIMRERLGANGAAANRFVNGYLGRADVTRKQQEVADQRRQIETLQANYEQRLSQAEQEKDQIMRDLANERITASKAQALLQTVKEAYGLTNRDLPGVEDIKQTEATGRVVDSTPDLEDRLKKFEERLFKKVNDQLIPEISALAVLTPVWNEISYEHERLHGKRLTKKEQSEILAEARRSNRSLEDVWIEKYDVPEKRMQARDSENKSKWRQEWDDEQAKRNQELALRGVRPEANEYAFEDQQSPIFRRSFAPRPEETHAEPSSGSPAVTASTDAARERMSGADRAAAKFMERARNGQLGKPLEPMKKTA